MILRMLLVVSVVLMAAPCEAADPICADAVARDCTPTAVACHRAADALEAPESERVTAWAACDDAATACAERMRMPVDACAFWPDTPP